MISPQFLQSCQSGDEDAIQSLVRTYQRGVFQLALSILDDADLNPGDPAGAIGEAVEAASFEAEKATRETFTYALDHLGRYREDTPFETWLYAIAIQMARRRARGWRTRRWLAGLFPNVLARFFANIGKGISAAVGRVGAAFARLGGWLSGQWKALRRPKPAARKKPAPADPYAMFRRPVEETPPEVVDHAGEPAVEERAAPAPVAPPVPAGPSIFHAERPVMHVDPRLTPADAELWRAVRRLDEHLRLPVVLRYYHDYPIPEIARLLRLSEGAVHARLDAAREKIARSVEKKAEDLTPPAPLP